jgi:aspartyl aminopeptidase
MRFVFLASLVMLFFTRLAAASSTKSTLRMSSSLPKRMQTLRTLKSKEQLRDEAHTATRLMEFIDQSPEPFHVVRTCIERLEALGFESLFEGDSWANSLKRGGKYYFTRNGSSIIAFTVGAKYESGRGFKIIGAHTDSPNLKLKPRTKRPGSNGLTQLAVECYGGGLWHTWFDRDLSLAGRVVVRDKDKDSGKFYSRLVKVDRPILRVPNLAIHLNTADERSAFKVNKEDHLVPILCHEVSRALSNNDNDNGDKAWEMAQNPEVLSLLAEELSCDVADIADFELSLYDTQKGAFNGLHSEFIASSRLDNLASCFVATEALASHVLSGGLNGDGMVSMVALFDHEEVGSTSSPGAGSTLMRDAIVRINDCLHHDSSNSNSNSNKGISSSEHFKASISRSLVLSVDQAHAIHPNYASKHEKGHSPQLNEGIVIKTNSNQRYATNGITGFIVRELGRRCGVPVQEFAVRNDCPCGSTIGPTISASTGIRAIDLGMPQLSMHSIREMMGTADVTMAVDLFACFLKDFREVDDAINVDKR